MRVKQGDIVIDATVGNGKDTFFLSELVSQQGFIYGFDIQLVALQKARQHLIEQNSELQVKIVTAEECNVGEMASGQHKENDGETASGQHEQSDGDIASEQRTPNIVLFEQSHAEMLRIIPESEHGQVAAVMFNLGYLPGGDHALTTQSETTLPALEAALKLIRHGGIVSIMVYTGHAGGKEEAEHVLSWVRGLPQRYFQVLQYGFINQVNDPPFLIAIVKL